MTMQTRADRLVPLPENVSSLSVARRSWNGVCLDVISSHCAGRVAHHLCYESSHAACRAARGSGYAAGGVAARQASLSSAASYRSCSRSRGHPIELFSAGFISAVRVETGEHGS